MAKSFAGKRALFGVMPGITRSNSLIADKLKQFLHLIPTRRQGLKNEQLIPIKQHLNQYFTNNAIWKITQHKFNNK